MAGKPVAGIPVRHSDELEQIVTDNGVSIGVIATPAGAAQQVCDRLVAAGVTSILNFAPTVLSVPEGVDVRKVDLSIELQILAFHEQRKAGEEPPQPPPSTVSAHDGAAVAIPVTGAPEDPAAQERKGPEGDLPAVMPA
jgi:redox-sensing transcriptional repressor